jgi:hypothetical protein
MAAAVVDSQGMSSRGKLDPLGSWNTPADDKVLKLLSDVILWGEFEPADAHMHWSMQLYIAR